MSWRRQVAKSRALFRLRKPADDLEEEIRAHLAMEEQENIESGMPPEEAHYAARRRFGNVTLAQERCREMWRWNWVESLLQDIRYGLRQLRRNSGFTAVAVITLALGIGANTAIFSVVDAILLRPLPYPQPDHLVKVWGNFTGIGIPDNRNAISAPEFKDLETQNRCFSDVAAIRGASANLDIGGTPERIQGAAVSPSLFPMLGVQAALGRTFLPQEAQPGRDKQVMLSHGLWERGFGGDPKVVGSRLRINGLSYAVVGVMPRGFDYPEGAEIWVPLAFEPDDLLPSSRANHELSVLARIKPEISLPQARADMEVLTKAVEEQNPDYPYARFQFAFLLSPLHEEMVSDVQKALWILSGAVALVLLIACVNVANLLLARGSAREQEMAVRRALGASRRRLVLQLLTESVLLSLIGGVAGVLLAYFGLHALITLSAAVFPRVATASMNGTVFAFTVLVSLGTGIVFGLAPSVHSSRHVTAESLREGGRTLPAGTVSERPRQALVVAELAFSLVLLSGAGVLLKSLLLVQQVDGGFRPDHVLTMRISLPEAKYSRPEQVRAFFRDILGRVSKLPGVEAAGAVSILPLSGSGSSGTTTMDTQAVPPDAASPEADKRAVTPGFFQAMGIPLISGRYFDERDSDQSPPVAIVDETLAKTYWPNEDAVGKRLHLGGPWPNPTWMTIVGVVRHVHYRTLEAPSRVEVYWPEAQRPAQALSLAIRTYADPLTLAATVQKEVQAIDPEQPVYRVRTMQELLGGSMAPRRLLTLLLSIFAGAALLLAAVGIYGVMAYSVRRRTHEIGIRMALGAQRREILRLVVRYGLKMTVAGVVAGLFAALALTRLIASLLYSVRPTDPTTFGIVVALLAAVALTACYIPARRATRVDPMVALRYE
jgi:predicted permease